jgi:hypothetical protein
MNKKLLPAALSLGSVILTAGGGILCKIAPPGNTETIFAVTISLFLLAATGMAVKGLTMLLSKRPFIRLVWAIVAFTSIITCTLAAVEYYKTYSKYVVTASNNIRYVIGDELTQQGEKEKPKKSNVTILDDFGEAERIWERKSIDAAKIKLLWGYYIMVIAIGLMLFSTSELCLMPKSQP